MTADEGRVINPGQLRALVVDDNAYVRAICGMSLRRLRFGLVEEADGGADALLMLMSAPYDLMLMDWYMPDVGGAGVMQVLRDGRFGAARRMPVIVMTGYARADTIERARELGIGEVLAKPFSTQQLGAAAGRILGGPLIGTGGEDVTFV